MSLRPGKLRYRIRIERPVPDDSLDGSGSGSWEPVAVGVPVEIEDVLPRNGESLADGINIRRRPAYVRMRYRAGVDGSMRFVLGTRIMAVISGPAEIGRRRDLEFMVEDWTSAGNGS